MASLHSCPCCGGTDIEEDSTHGVVVSVFQAECAILQCTCVCCVRV